MKIKMRSRGDTIIEVMISIAVVSFILGASYSLANSSTQVNRQAQERGEALKYSETQIEQLKAYLSDPNKPEPSGFFCIKPDGTPTSAGAFASPLPNPNNAASDGLTSYPSDCKKSNIYHSFIRKDGDTYRATTRWYRIGGGGIDEVSLFYRVYR